MEDIVIFMCIKYWFFSLDGDGPSNLITAFGQKLIMVFPKKCLMTHLKILLYILCSLFYFLYIVCRTLSTLMIQMYMLYEIWKQIEMSTNTGNASIKITLKPLKNGLSIILDRLHIFYVRNNFPLSFPLGLCIAV